MAFYRCNLGGGINLLNADKVQVIGSSTGTTNITVTQKPRYIVMATWTASGTQYNGQVGIVDVVNNTAKRCGYWSSAGQSWSAWTNWTNYFTSITASRVTYNSAAWSSATSRAMILIYY